MLELVAKGEEKPESDLDIFILGEASGPLLHLDEARTRIRKGDHR